MRINLLSFSRPAARRLRSEEPSVFQEAIDQGATRFFGKAEDRQAVHTDGKVTSYTFTTASGPEWPRRASSSTATVRDTGSSDLFIFLQGQAGRAGPTSCLATSGGACRKHSRRASTSPIRPRRPTRSRKRAPSTCPTATARSSRATAKWSSSRQRPAVDRIQHGLPERLGGARRGVQAVPEPQAHHPRGEQRRRLRHHHRDDPRTRARYPGRPILVFEDSGSGLGNPTDTTVISRILTQFNAMAMIPKSCTDCIANGLHHEAHRLGAGARSAASDLALQLFTTTT